MSSHVIPEFKSSIPSHLLDGLSDKDKYIIEQLSVMGQKTDWIVGETGEQSKKLGQLETGVSEVDTKLKFTNGKIASALVAIKALEDKNLEETGLLEEVRKIVNAKNFLEKLLFNKWFWFVFGIFMLGAIKIITTPELMELVKKIAGIG